MAALKKLGILLSGRGSNFEAIADSIKAGRLHAEIAIVISNRADAPGLESAKRRGLNAVLIPSKGRVREEHDAEVVAALEASAGGLDLPGRLYAPAFAGFHTGFSQSHCQYSSVTVAGIPRHGRAETGAGIWRKGNGMHRAFCRRASGPRRQSFCRKLCLCWMETTCIRSRRGFWSRSTRHILRRLACLLSGES